MKLMIDAVVFDAEFEHFRTGQNVQSGFFENTTSKQWWLLMKRSISEKLNKSVRMNGG